MPEFVRVLSFKTPRHLSKPSAGAAFVIAVAALVMLHAPRVAAFDDQLSAEAIDRLVAARSKEVLTGRATPIERIGQYLTNDLRPQQTGAAATPGARRMPGTYPLLLLASVGRDSLPMSFPLDATPLPDAGAGPLALTTAGSLPAAEPGGESHPVDRPARIASPSRCARCWPRLPPTSGRCG
jgi:hypothetical protein